MDNKIFNKLTIKQLAVIAAVLFVGLFGWQFYRMSQFHVIKTDPKLSGVSTVSPYVRFYFNDPIVEDGLQIADPDEIITGRTVQGKVLTLNLNGSLNAHVPYSITIERVANRGGETLTDLTYDFTAKVIASNKLSKEQQATLLQGQDKAVYGVDHIDYPGFEQLLEYGISSEQLQNIKSNLFDYSNVVSKQFWTMKLVSGSISVPQTERGSVNRSIDFTVILGGEAYQAHAEYNVLYDPVHLQLRNTAGVQVFDSANIGD